MLANLRLAFEEAERMSVLYVLLFSVHGRALTHLCCSYVSPRIPGVTSALVSEICENVEQTDPLEEGQV